MKLRSIRWASCEDWQVASAIVTEDRVRWAISLFACFKSPGWDGIFPASLQKGLHIILSHLIIQFRACVTVGHTPCQWRTARVVFSPRMMHWIYMTVIRPMITHAAVVWWPRVELGVAKQLLGRVQLVACLAIIGVIRTTPTAAMEYLLGLLPLDTHIYDAFAVLCLGGTWLASHLHWCYLFHFWVRLYFFCLCLSFFLLCCSAFVANKRIYLSHH